MSRKIYLLIKLTQKLRRITKPKLSWSWKLRLAVQIECSPCHQSGKCSEDWFDQTKAKKRNEKNTFNFSPYFCLHCPRNPMRQDQPPQFSSPCHCPARQNFLSEILQYFKRNSIKDLSRNEEIMNNNRRE